MNRYLILTVLVIIYSFCSHLVDDHPQAINDQETNLVDYQNSDHPIDDNGKLKDISFIPQIVLVLIVLGVNSFFSLFATFTRRLMLLTTIFYQSNYLISSLK